jgi:hypothetical protein
VVTHATAPDLEAAVERALFAPDPSGPDAGALEEWTTTRQMARLVRAVAALPPRDRYPAPASPSR